MMVVPGYIWSLLEMAVPKLLYSRNQRTSIRATLRRVERVFLDEVIKPLNAGFESSIELRRFFMDIEPAIRKIGGILKEHVKALIAMEIIEGVSFSELTEGEQTRLYSRLMNDSSYQQALENLKDRIQTQIMAVVSGDDWTQLLDIDFEELRDDLLAVGRSEIHSLRRTLLMESQVVVNNTKEEMYAKEEEEFGVTYYYRWATARDDRLTPCCREIREIVEAKGNRVTMDELKPIVRQMSIKHMGLDYPYREWNPHWNCRSTFVRVA